MQPKRLLYLSHRWLGVVLCLFFAPWFISGVVMMYVGHPKLTAPERLFATLMQAAGRAGRDAAAAERSEMFVQTWNPGHAIFAALSSHDSTIASASPSAPALATSNQENHDRNFSTL